MRADQHEAAERQLQDTIAELRARLETAQKDLGTSQPSLETLQKERDDAAQREKQVHIDLIFAGNPDLSHMLRICDQLHTSVNGPCVF